MSRRPEWTGSSVPEQVRLLTARSLRTSFGNPRLVFYGLLQPIVLLLLFSQVFRGVAALPGVAVYHAYIDYLMPATMVNIAVVTAMSSGVGVMAEIYTGFIGRLRTMPISMTSVLAARTLADATRLAVQLVVITGAAFAFLDFRPADLAGTAAAGLLAVFTGWGVGWLFVAIATWQSKPEVMQTVSFVVMFPLMFTSSAYMPVSSMPTPLRWIARVNPLTYAVDAARRLCFAQPFGSALGAALLLVCGAAAVGSFLAVRNFTVRS